MTTAVGLNASHGPGPGPAYAHAQHALDVARAYGPVLDAWDELDAPSTSIHGARREDEVAKLWTLARAYLYPRDIGPGARPPRAPEVPEQLVAVKRLLSVRMGRGDVDVDVGQEHGMDGLEGDVGVDVSVDAREELAREVMDRVKEGFGWVRRDVRWYMGRLRSTAAVALAPQTETIMNELLDKLHLWHRRWAMPLKVFDDQRVISAFTSLFQTLLHASLPADFLSHFERFLQLNLANLPNHLRDPLATTTTDNGSTPAAAAAEKIPPPSPHLTRLGMLPRYSSVLSSVAYAEIDRIVREEAERGWDARRLARIRQRVSCGVVNWIAACFDQKSAGTSQFLRATFVRFDAFLCKSLCDIRTEQLFDIIVDHPDSLAALEDLKEAMNKVGQRDELVTKLKAANLKRLLHPGARTRDVLTQYISTIRCLRILDPPGVLLHKVALPIRKHLRARPDTTKEIVAALVEGDELQDENEAGGLIKESNDDEVEDFLNPLWEPEPVDAAPEFRSGKAGDIVSTLVSIFETREVIIKELQMMLAQRLQEVTDYDAVKEIRIIELLKLRFGEAALQGCDVMLKDMADSKRIDDRIHGDINNPLHPLIISHRFWPPVPPSSLHLPPKLHAAQQTYEDAFHHFKPDKHLRFLQDLGRVTLRLEMQDRVLEVSASPLEAAVVEVMEEKGTWGLEELAQRLGVEQGVTRAALMFWAGEGVVLEEEGAWRVLETEE